MKNLIETKYEGSCKHAIDFVTNIEDRTCSLKGCSENCLCPRNMKKCDCYEK